MDEPGQCLHGRLFLLFGKMLALAAAKDVQADVHASVLSPGPYIHNRESLLARRI